MSNLSHTNESDYAELDAMMGFDPSNTQIFNAADGSVEPLDIYRTSPKDSKTEDGHYHSKVRLLYNVHNRNRTIVHSVIYNLRDEEGYFSVQSLLGEKDPYSPYFKEYKSCPIFKTWKKLHFSEDPKVKERGDEYFKKYESDWILVQVVEDKNKPEMVGKILPWKLPKAVLTKLQNKMSPSKDSGKIPVNILDLLTGRVLDIDVTPGPQDKADPSRYFRETKYDLSEFDTDPTPITKIDGTPLFTDEEIEIIEKYDKKITAIAKMKSPEERESAFKLLKENQLYSTIREYMQRAYEYVKENSEDLVELKGYKPWSDELTARVTKYIETVLSGKNPLGTDDTFGYKADGSDIDKIFAAAPAAPSSPTESTVPGMDDDDLPF